MWLWLDDVRPMPAAYHARAWTAQEATEFLTTGEVTFISFDHDLGDEDNGTGYEVACFIEECAYHNVIPRLDWEIHSDNPPGSANIKRAMQSADRYWNRF